jgi:hypothetical protein
MRKRVYKSTCAQYGISNLEKKRLKLSTIKGLNDSFDLSPLDTTSLSYEQEVRMFTNLYDPPDAEGQHRIEFGPLLVLKEVIIGAQCDPIVSKKVEEAVRPSGDAVKWWWAGLRPDAFLLVKQDHPADWHALAR